MTNKSLFEVPIYITAKTKEELIALMLKNNHAKKAWCSYSFPQQDDKGEWVVWYYYDVTKVDDFGEVIDGK